MGLDQLGRHQQAPLWILLCSTVSDVSPDVILLVVTGQVQRSQSGVVVSTHR